MLDVIGDVHGCREELDELIALLDPARRIVFVGDLCDRGPDTPGVLRLVMRLVREGRALAVVGNHDDKLMRALRGARVKAAHGLEVSLRQLEEEPESFRAGVAAFFESLPTHLLLDEGRLLVSEPTEGWGGRVAVGLRLEAGEGKAFYTVTLGARSG